MKTKFKLSNRILSLVLALVMVVGLLPMMSMKAFAATEVPELGAAYNPITYSDGATQFYKYNNYLYKVTYTNWKMPQVAIAFSTSYDGRFLRIWGNASGYSTLYKEAACKNKVGTSDFPTTQGTSVSYYSTFADYVSDTKKPVVTITCLALNNPTWSWASNNASASAVFTVDGTNYRVTVKASVSSETVSTAANCQQKGQIQYKATATFNGQTYTDTRTADGAAGPHSYTKETVADNYLKSAATCTAAAVYYKSCEYCGTSSNSDDATFTHGSALGHTLRYAVKEGTTNVCEETCINNCGHSATATLTAEDKYYEPNTISAHGSVTYSGNWIGDKNEDYAFVDGNVGTATAEVTLIFISLRQMVTLTCNYQVLPLDISASYAQFWPDVYNGSPLNATVFYRTSASQIFGARLNEDDYTLVWDKTDLTQVGEYQVTVTGKGNYTGSFTQKWTVMPADLKNVSVVNNKAAFDYTGEAQKLDVTANGETVDGADITFTYRVGEIGEYVAEPAVTARGTYTVYWKASAPNHNDVTGSFTVTVDPANGVASVSVADVEYGDPVIPVPTSSTNGTDNVTYQYKVKGADDSTYTSEVPTAVGSYTVKATFAATENYKEVTAVADFEISKRKVTVTAQNTEKTYGDADPALNWTVTSGTELASEPLAINISRAEGDNAGNYTITVSQTEEANPNYDITFVNGTFTINKAPLAVTAENKTATYGDAVPTYTVTYSGFVNGDDKEDLGGTLAFDCAYAQFADKGTYTITPSGYESGNYEITYVPGTLTVGAKEITVTIADKTSVYGEEIVELAADDNGGIVNGDTNVYTLATTATKTSDVGTYDITGTTLDSNYAITFVDGTYTITKAQAVGTAPAAVSGLVYNTSAQTLIAAGSTYDGTMVYSLEKEGEYIPELPTATTAGTYHVWYKVNGDKNHEDSAPDYIEVKIDKADPGIGSVTAGVVNDTLKTSAIVLTRENTDIDGNLTVDAEQTLSLGENTIRYTFTPTDGTNYKVVTGEVTVIVADTIAPTGTVTISTKSWAEFLNTITFGLFFKETQTVSVAASDNLSGVAKIEYIESKTAMDLDAVKAAEQWTEMENGSVSVTLEDTKQFVYYIRITDKSGNITYLSSDGAEYDTTAPVIEGVDNGKTYYTTQIVTVTDKNIDTITLNDEAATGPITLEGNKEATYTIVATDKAGNSTTITVKMAPIADIVSSMEGKTDANVTSDDKTNLQTIVDTATELLQDEDITAEEKAELEKAKADAEALIQVIEDTAAELKAVTDKAAEFDEDKVKSTDKAELEKLAEDIEALLDTDNLTQDERTGLETILEQVEGMIDTIDETAADIKAATDVIDALDPDTVKSTDKTEIEKALETIEDLLDGNHLTKGERDALIYVKADAEALLDAIEEAAKAADTENTAKVEDVTADNVTPEDKSALEDAKADLEKALEDNNGNYTEEEKKTIEDEIARIDEALEVIENVEAIEDAIADLPATVEPDDEETVAKIEDAKKAYDELTEYEKSLVDEDAKEKLDDLTDAAVAYKIVKGDGSQWTKGGTSGLSFTANGPLGKFGGIEIDGKVIDAKYYDAVAGSTVITLKASYLETLSAGEHTIAVVYTDGEASGTFKIQAESTTLTTGADSNTILYGSVFAIILAALVVLILVIKKRKQAS